MRVTDVKLKNYRSYAECDFVPCTGINVLLGDNGQGKTNLLEAVYLCCAGRSHRTRQDRELISWGADFASVQLRAERRDGGHDQDQFFLLCCRHKRSPFSGRCVRFYVGGSDIKK